MKTKILIACEPSTDIQKVISDLKCAGFSSGVEAVILSVADMMAPPVIAAYDAQSVMIDEAYLTASRLHIKKGIQKAQELASKAASQLRKAFPSWKIKSEGCADSPAWALIKKAESWGADLVVVGAHKSNALERLVFGSVAQKVAGEAACSVRVLHGQVGDSKVPTRIVIGIDGSQDSNRAVAEVARRQWKKGSAVHLVSVAEPHMAWEPAKKRASKTDSQKKHWLEHTIAAAQRKLRHTGLTVSAFIKEGNPQEVLTREAKSWGADVIFLGARGLRGIERFLIGSVSSGVAVHAHCTVEIVRPAKRN